MGIRSIISRLFRGDNNYFDNNHEADLQEAASHITHNDDRTIEGVTIEPQFQPPTTFKKTNENEYSEVLSEKEITELNRQSYRRALEFRAIAKAETDKINIEALRKIVPGAMCELKPEEILFMSYIAVNKTDLDIPGYFTHEYHVDFQNALEKFFSNGYITFGDYHTAVNNMKIAELKLLLAEFSQSQTGAAKTLRERVLSTIPYETLSARYDDKYFNITITGEKFLQNNEHIMYFHSAKNKLDISIYRADNYKKQHPNLTNKQIAYALIGTGNKYVKEQKYGLYRNVLYQKSYIAQKEKLPDEELFFLFQCCFLDCCGYNNVTARKLCFLAPGLISRIKIILKKKDKNFSDMYDEFKHAIEEIKVPYNPQDIDSVYNELLKNV